MMGWGAMGCLAEWAPWLNWTLHSVLDDIPNVGEKRRRDLLMKFGSVDNIKKASIEELLEIPSINKKSAESIYIYFNGNN